MDMGVSYLRAYVRTYVAGVWLCGSEVGGRVSWRGCAGCSEGATGVSVGILIWR